MVTCSGVDTVKEGNVKSWHALTALIPIPVQGLYIKHVLQETSLLWEQSDRLQFLTPAALIPDLSWSSFALELSEQPAALLWEQHCCSSWVSSGSLS